MMKKRIVFGLIESAKSVTRYFLQKYNISYVVDNDRNKQGTYFEGVPVYAVEMLQEEKKGEIDILIAVKSSKKEISKQLEQMGFIYQRDFFFFYEKYEEGTFYDYFKWRYTEKDKQSEKYLPQTLLVELSSACNLKCAYCPYHGFADIKRGRKRNMTWDTLKKVTKEVKKISSIKTIDTCGAGEIFINKEWFEMLQYLHKETKIPNLIIYTNGMLLNEDIVDKLNRLNFRKITLEVSIDGLTPDENDVCRKGALYSVVHNNLRYAIDNLNGNKFEYMVSNAYVVDQKYVEEYKDSFPDALVPSKYLQEDFPEAIVSSKAYGVFPDEEGNIPKNEFLEFVHVKRKCISHCTNLFTHIFVSSDGELPVCQCGFASNISYGNINDVNDLLMLWQTSSLLEEARKKMDELKEPDFCKNCLTSPGGFICAVRKQDRIMF